MFNRMLYFRDVEITPALIESVAVVHFARFAQKIFPYAKLNDVAFYWKNKKETDIILLTGGGCHAIWCYIRYCTAEDAPP